jgi:hypothetical protein
METVAEITDKVRGYIAALDWQYIITFIIICFGINHYKVKEGLQKVTGVCTRTRYRVIIVGVVYGAGIYFIRGYKLIQLENLVQSCIFALVFHKFIIEAVLFWLVKHGLPESISKHLVDSEQIKKINGTEDK